MPQCCVFGCYNQSGNRENISHYSFPNRATSPQRFAIWKKRMNREEYEPSKSSNVCSIHFAPSDFEESDLMRMKLMPDSFKRGPRLKPGSVPSLRLKGVESSQDPSSCKKSSFSRHSRARKDEKSVQQSMVEPISDEGWDVHQFGDKDKLPHVTGKEHVSSANVETQCEMGGESYRQFDIFNSKLRSVPNLKDTDLVGSDGEVDDREQCG